MKKYLPIVAILSVNFWLNIYGNHWGLPSRWHADEKVTNVLHMADKKTLIDTRDYFNHPTGYQMALMVYLAPYFIYLEAVDYPLAELKSAASVSWMETAKNFPDFASTIFIYSRTLSAILGTLTVLLIFFIAKKIYGRRTGIFSAASLALTMGFVGVNHVAKQFSLFNFLLSLAMLFCIYSLTQQSLKVKKRYMLFAFFFGGLLVSTQFNGLIICILLAFTFFFSRTKLNTILILLITFLAGILAGTPTLITNFSDYFGSFSKLWDFGVSAQIFDGSIFQKIYHLFLGPVNYFFEILTIYGIVLFALIICGIYITLRKWRQLNRQELIIFSFVGIYFLIMTVFFGDKYPQVKHIIAIIPFLVIFSGIALNHFYSNDRIPHFMKIIFIALIFMFSFLYSLEGDRVFINGDTRYKSTQWITENIPKGSKIEIFTLLSYICSDRIFYDYELIYLGRSSKNNSSKHFYTLDNSSEHLAYLKKLNQTTSDADYIIISFKDYKHINSPDYKAHIPGLSVFIQDLFKGIKKFYLIETIQPQNRKIRLKNFSDIILHENLLWDPMPLYGSTGNTIYIFKKSDA